MSTRKFSTAALLPLAVLLMSCAAPLERAPAAPGSLGIGRVATDAEIRGWDVDVTPDGRGLPAGSGSVAAGRTVYAARCASCHGAAGEGAAAPRLVGGAGTLAGKSPVRTIGSFWPYATTVYDYVYRSMPFDQPMSLTPQEVYGVTAFLLHANGIVGADAVMDAKSLPAVRMPNRDGFLPAPAQPDVRTVRCMADCTN